MLLCRKLKSHSPFYSEHILYLSHFNRICIEKQKTRYVINKNKFTQVMLTSQLIHTGTHVFSI